jgi:acyl-coenzyme A thioesterase PaaI-like protein
VLKIGKRTAVAEGRATDEAGTVVAIATSTFTLLP